jgi:glycosyltransferase involved in cell wall biosynthesis
VQIDADGQHEPREIKILLDNLIGGSYDIVLGSRFLVKNNYKQSIFRLLGRFFFRMVLRLVYQINISDPTTGFRAMNKKVLHLFIKDVFPADYPDADVIILLSEFDLKIKEVPIKVYPNAVGKSMHQGFLHSIYYIFKMLLSMFVTKLRQNKTHDL